MKPNKTLFGAFVISVTLIIGACQQTELSDSAPTPSLPAPAAEFVADDSDLSAGDAAAVAKAIRDFSKEKGNEALVIKGAILGGQQLLSKEQVFALADLPSKETLIAQVVGTIAAPLRGLVTVLSGPQRNFVTVLERIKEQKESAA